MYRGGALPPSLCTPYTPQGAQCNTSYSLYPILHGITRLDSNPRPPLPLPLHRPLSVFNRLPTEGYAQSGKFWVRRRRDQELEGARNTKLRQV
jgi:hypothetical protein